MKRDHWDAILASAPLNATAASVTARSKVEGPQQELSPEYSWEVPPYMPGPQPKHFANPSFIDFTGKTIGRLKVIGLTVGNDGGSLWVCRCACGRYVGRRARSLKKVGIVQMCNACGYTLHLREAASGNNARLRAESVKARKWKTQEELEAEKRGDLP